MMNKIYSTLTRKKSLILFLYLTSKVQRGPLFFLKMHVQSYFVNKHEK